MAEDFFGKWIVFHLPGMDAVQVEPNIAYKEAVGAALRLDVYRPSSAMSGERYPGVAFVHGDGPTEVIRNAKDWGQYVSWGRLVAASGLVGITFNHRSTEARTRLAEAASDVDDLIAFVRTHAADVSLDPDRLCLWTCSMGPPVAFHGVLPDPPPFVTAIVSYYGVLDLMPLRDETATEVTDGVLEEYSPLRRLWRSTRSLPPILIARAGKEDRPWLNPTIDRFVADAIARGAEVDLLTHPRGRHAFDVLDDDSRSQDIIARTLDFLVRHATGRQPSWYSRL